MNLFEENFFIKYIPEWQELFWIIHKHFSVVFLRLFFWLSLAILPSFMFYYSQNIKELVPFYFLEIYLIIIYIKIIYDIFDWYNDVWIVTNTWIIDLNWSLFKKKIDSVEFWNIEWLWVEQNGFIDTILKKWDLVIHKIWDDKFILQDVFNPFKAVDLIEEISAEQEQEEDEVNITEERFNMLINTLWWIMEWYSKKDKEKEEKISKYNEKIENIRWQKWTIDLR